MKSRPRSSLPARITGPRGTGGPARTTRRRDETIGRKERPRYRRLDRHRPGDGDQVRGSRRKRRHQLHASETEAEITLEEARDACSLIREKGCREMLVQGDVASEEDVKRIFAEVLTAWGRLDILVNNAGIQTASPTHEMTADAYDRVLAVNLRGAFFCAREAVRHFLDRGGGGVILNNTSVHEAVPKPLYATYAASKAGLGALGRTLALEYSSEGIRVNAVAPGAIATPINRE
ncbi:3-phenylpropionate-dihydrodiol/cinnamic acid-dihydrodiol dehydrogenase [anaerobic digester metagenome]